MVKEYNIEIGRRTNYGRKPNRRRNTRRRNTRRVRNTNNKRNISNFKYGGSGEDDFGSLVEVFPDQQNNIAMLMAMGEDLGITEDVANEYLVMANGDLSAALSLLGISVPGVIPSETEEWSDQGFSSLTDREKQELMGLDNYFPDNEHQGEEDLPGWAEYARHLKTMESESLTDKIKRKASSIFNCKKGRCKTGTVKTNTRQRFPVQMGRRERMANDSLGFVNREMTQCYLIALIQCLTSVPVFRDFFREKSQLPHYRDTIIAQLADIANKKMDMLNGSQTHQPMKFSGDSSINIIKQTFNGYIEDRLQNVGPHAEHDYDIVNMSKFLDYRYQNDSSEFMVHLFGLLDNHLERGGVDAVAEFNDLRTIEHDSETICFDCAALDENGDPVFVPQHSGQEIPREFLQRTTGTPTREERIKQVLDVRPPPVHHEVDILTLIVGDTEYAGARVDFNCKEEFPHCPQNEGAIKKKNIVKSPKVLIVNIARFFNLGAATGKLDTKIRYDNNIDLSQIGGSQYDLKAVVYHHGRSIEAGHYTAHCREDDGWVYYDDSSATYVRNRQEQPYPGYQPGHHEFYQEKCYILFYQLIEEATEVASAVATGAAGDTTSIGGRGRIKRINRTKRIKRTKRKTNRKKKNKRK